MNKLVGIPILALIMLGIDWYAFQAVKTITSSRVVHVAYWTFTALLICAFFAYHFLPPDSLGKTTRQFIMVAMFINYFSKFFGAIFLLLEDLSRLVRWLLAKGGLYKVSTSSGGISRAEFISKTAIGAALVPAATLTFGIISGAHDYRVRRHTVRLKNLPKGFDGMKIGQLSDIHSGSFFNKTAVKGGVEMMMAEKPDMIFFTGDLVNNEAKEVQDYLPIFSKLKADLGVFSTLGNHDYGDYHQWNSKEEKKQNLADLIQSHKLMGWDILLDENRSIKLGNESIGIVGVQNWGAGERWPKYGNLTKALKGAEEQPVKLLLSHDPSHWDGQVRQYYKDIDVQFAGHTHGMQFGIENELFKWSPSQYVYKQWAGMYTEGHQSLYVNRGFGYLGYPGRVGILPELTIFELKKA
jgi:uncharacterized protein